MSIIKPRVLCTLDRAMGLGDGIMVHSILKDLSCDYDLRVMCSDRSYDVVQYYRQKNIEIYNVSQQSKFFTNDHIKCYNLIYWDVYNSLRQLEHQAINLMRQIANLPLYTKELNRELPDLYINPEILAKMELLLNSLPHPIITVHPLVSYWSKMMDPIKYKYIIQELSKLGTVIQLCSSISKEYISPHGINLINKTTIEESLAILKYSDIVFCGDTFIQHAAAALKTPAVVFYCGTSPTDFGYPFFKNIFHPELVSCQIKCGRPMRWLYDYTYSNTNDWNSRNEAGWHCDLKLCDQVITPDEILSAVECELKIGRERNWAFYDVTIDDFFS